MKTMIPKKLKKNATIGLLSTSGNIADFELLKKSKKYFENKGYNVKISQNSYHQQRYLAGNDEERAQAINKFFEDTEIDCIVATRGGYGAIRILDKIDWELIKSNPKIFVGYSDLTALEIMIYKKTGLITYNGPMAIPDFSEEIYEYTEKSFWAHLQNKIVEIKIDNPQIYREGSAKGILWGGNLATIQSLCGLDFIPDTPFIFITEDINEPSYKIDKMFTQLLNIKIFRNNLAGVVLGNFSGIDNKEYLDAFFIELANKLEIPIIGGIKFGHIKEKQTIPIGIQCTMKNNILKLIQ